MNRRTKCTLVQGSARLQHHDAFARRIHALQWVTASLRARRDQREAPEEDRLAIIRAAKT